MLMNSINAESSFVFHWFAFILQFWVSMLFLQLWDSENDISTSAVLSVVMPVHLVYAGTMVGTACARDDPNPNRYIWKFNFRTVFPTFVLSIPRCMIAHIWSYSTPRTVTVPSILDRLSPSDLVLAVHYIRLVVVQLGLSPYGYISSSLTQFFFCEDQYVRGGVAGSIPDELRKNIYIVGQYSLYS